MLQSTIIIISIISIISIIIVILFILSKFTGLIKQPTIGNKNDAKQHDLKPNSVYFPYVKNTDLRDRGDGSNVNLDRDNIDCEVNGINQFRYNTDAYGDKNIIRYDVQCLHVPRNDDVNNPTQMQTGFQSNGGGNIAYLDRHNVDCGNGGFLTQFHFNRNSDNMQYSYKCGHADNLTCRSVGTEWNDSGTSPGERGNGIGYLDRHNVSCGVDEVISQFQLQTSDGTRKIRYVYNCCKKT